MKKKFLASVLATAIICNGSVVAFANENTETVASNSAEVAESSKEDSKESSKEGDETKKTELQKENSKEQPKSTETETSKPSEKTTTNSENSQVNNVKPVQGSEVKNVSKPKKTSEDNRHQETVTQLGYAIEEMKDAINLLDNADFTNQENHDAMTAYATAALNRVRGFQEENISKDMITHINWIEESGDEIRSANYSILRLLTAINNVKAVFSGENETLENKKNVLNTLNEVINHEAESYGLNEKTLNSAKNILNSYAEQIKPEEDNRDQETVTQLGYAIEEMRIAIDLLDNADFTKQSNYERMISFATAALDRVRGFETENISEDMIVHIEWIEKSGDEIRNETYRLNRILTAINNIEIVFSPDREDIAENMKIVLNILNTIINEEEDAGYVNEATLTSAKNILEYYWNRIPATPGNPDDNMEVEPPVGDGSGDDNMEVEPPVGDGSDDDNMQVESPVGDGSDDDNMQVEPPVGDGSDDDNMQVEPPVGDGSGDDNMEVEPPVGDGSGDDNMEVEPPVGDGSDNIGVNPSVGENSNNNNTGTKPSTNINKPKPTLPQTGVATTSLFGLGIASTLIGSFLRKRK